MQVAAAEEEEKINIVMKHRRYIIISIYLSIFFTNIKSLYCGINILFYLYINPLQFKV